VISTRLHEVLGYQVSIGDLNVDKQSRKLIIKDFGLSLSKESAIFFKIGKLEGILPEDYNDVDEIVIDSLMASNLSLPLMESESPSETKASEAYKEFYDVDTILEVSKANSSKMLQERFSDLKSLLTRYKLTKSESSACKSKKRKKKCNAIKAKKLKIQKEILALVENKQLFNLKDIIKENGPAVQRFEFNDHNIFKFLIKDHQNKVSDSLVLFMKKLYDAQFINLTSSDKIPHLTIKEIFIREKISKAATKELVGSIKDLSSDRSKMKDKTLFRVQGDFDKYNMKGVSFRMLLHRGKNNAVSMNSHILDMNFDGHTLFNGDREKLQINKANGSVKVKAFIFGGLPKGSITTDLKEVSFNSIGYGKGISKLKNLNVLTNYERKEEGSYTDSIVTLPKGFKIDKIKDFEKKASNELEDLINSNEEMLNTYDVFLKNYAVNFNLTNEDLKKLWPSYKSNNIRLDNQQ